MGYGFFLESIPHIGQYISETCTAPEKRGADGGKDDVRYADCHGKYQQGDGETKEVC